MSQEQRDGMTKGIETCISCLPGKRTPTILERVLCVNLTTKGEHFGHRVYPAGWRTGDRHLLIDSLDPPLGLSTRV